MNELRRTGWPDLAVKVLRIDWETAIELAAEVVLPDTRRRIVLRAIAEVAGQANFTEPD